ncbi:hypothetical protein GCM10010103_62810 [Streptomyces paradoxus]
MARCCRAATPATANARATRAALTHSGPRYPNPTPITAPPAQGPTAAPTLNAAVAKPPVTLGAGWCAPALGAGHPVPAPAG